MVLKETWNVEVDGEECWGTLKQIRKSMVRVSNITRNKIFLKNFSKEKQLDNNHKEDK